MTSEIKQRIEQINNGQVPTGYKETEFGIFPCDWVTDKTFGDLFSFNGGLSKSREELSENGIEYLHYGDMHRSDFNIASLEQYSKLPKYDTKIKGDESFLMQDGDVAFLDASEDLEGTSRSVLIDNPENKPFIAGLHIIYGKPRGKELLKYYKQYLTRPEYIKKQFKKLASGFKVYGLNRNTITGIKCAYPKSTAEQEKIAEILMKWDKVIELQEKYIEKLAEKRKYIFHSLFLKNDNWTCKKLQNVINVLSGYAFKSETYVEDGKYLIITIANVNDNRFSIDKNTKKVNSIPKDIREYQKLQINDIIMSLTGNVARICKVSSKNCLLNQRVAKIEVKKEYDKDFVFYLLQTFKFSEYMKMYAQGAAQDNLSVKDIYRFQVYLPKTIEEQNAISKKLSTYDLILKNEDKKLNLLKQQRKALQQYLLNGIVRVEV